MSYSFVDALQMGGASATVMGIMFLAYKAVTLAVNHRCRSDCCGRGFSLGIQWVELTPPSHRLSAAEAATLGHRLLDGFQTSEKHDGNPSVSSLVSPTLALAKNTSPAASRNLPTVVEVDKNSPVQSHQSTAPPIVPS